MEDINISRNLEEAKNNFFFFLKLKNQKKTFRALFLIVQSSLFELLTYSNSTKF